MLVLIRMGYFLLQIRLVGKFSGWISMKQVSTQIYDFHMFVKLDILGFSVIMHASQRHVSIREAHFKQIASAGQIVPEQLH